jgi:hypothetical protein
VGINIALPDLVSEGDARLPAAADRLPLMNNRRRRTMKTLIAALAVAVLVAAPSFTPPAAAAARKADRDACQSGQNDNCYYRGYPLWQWYSS